MNTNPTDPIVFSASPLDFSQPVECRFQQLATVRDKAAAAGWSISRMTVIRLGYRLTFQRDAGRRKDSYGG